MTDPTPTGQPRESGADEFRLPQVGGRRISTSNDDFERKCLVHLDEEQRKISPENGLVALLCEAVRLVREYNDFASTHFELGGEDLKRRIADNEKIRSLETRLSASEARGKEVDRTARSVEDEVTNLFEILNNCAIQNVHPNLWERLKERNTLLRAALAAHQREPT